MTHHPWDPLRDLLDLQERINRLLEENLARGHLAEPHLPSPTWVPLADVCETQDAFVALIELPGLAREDIDVRAEAHALTVRGHRSPGTHLRDENFLRMERSHGPFQRTFQLTDEVVPDQVTADLADGVLRILLPKARQRSRRVLATRVE
jgi:HSP20 family protein